VSLSVEVNNASPPFTPPWADGAVAPPEEDPHWGYYTRWNRSAIAIFLPRGAEVDGNAAIDGQEFRPIMRSVLDRPYFYRTNELFEPGQKKTLTVKYEVPAAAVVDGDTLTYRLDLDPQGMVTSQKVDVTVHAPEGFAPTVTPEGWKLVDDSTLTYSNGGLDDSPRFEVPFSRS
jgi:hypothetical protein